MTTAKTVTTPNDALNRVLAKICRTLEAREITLRYLPPPSGVRWIATALLDYHKVLDKIRADIPQGSLSLADVERYNDMPIARGEGGTATDAIAAMTPLTWKAPR
jgi:hypothetical protein